VLYRISRVRRKRLSPARPFSTAIILPFEAPPPAPRRRRQNNFSFPAKRRREIVLHARYVGAADTEDFSRWLIAWVWHNPKAKDQIWSVMEAAKNMGGNITEAQASAITEEASITRKHLSADNLARFLGVTYPQRQALRLTTIGSVNVGKRARKEIRNIRDKVKKEQKRRAAGVRPRAEYEANSTAAKARAEGVSRITIYRRRRAAEQVKNRPDVTGVSAAIFLSSEDRPVSPEGGTGLAERVFDPKQEKKKRGLPSSQTATTVAADTYVTAHNSLPLELRLLALGLQSEGPSANVITADDPRMVARMTANGGGR
jgi:hypothetical protein